MAKFLNTILSEVLVSLENDYNVYEVFDKEDANVVLNDVQESDFPIAFFSIKNNGTVTLTSHKKSYPVYDVAVWLLKLYEEDDKTELETNYEQLRLDALEFEQRLQRTEEFARVPTNTVLSPRHDEFDADLDLLATALQISFTISIDLGEDTSRVCVPLNISSFTVNDSDLDAVVLDASASSFRGATLGAIGGLHEWVFTMNETSVTISGLATDTLTSADIALLDTIGISNATGNYNSFTFNKNPNFSGNLNYDIEISHTFDYRGKGLPSEPTEGLISRRVFVYISTDWDIEDGNFTALFDTVSGDCTLVVGDNEYTGTSFSINDPFFDGTEKEVILLAPSGDYSLIDNFDITANVVGNLDISLLTNAERIDVRLNSGLTGLTTASLVLGDNDGLRANSCGLTGVLSFAETLFTNTAFVDLTSNTGLQEVGFSTDLGLNSISDLRVSNCDITGVLDCSNASIQTIQSTSGSPNWTGINLYSGSVIDGNTLIVLGANLTGLLDLTYLAVSSVTVQFQSLTSVVFSGLSKSMSTIGLNGQNIRTIDFGGAQFSGFVTLQFQGLNNDGLMNSSQISQIVIDIASRSSSGFGVMRFDGNNPSLNASGMTAKTTLEGLGYTVLFN